MDPIVNDPISHACPRCAVEGRPVKPVTPRSLLNEGAKRRGIPLEGLRFCSTPACDVAYYGQDGVFVRDELVVRIGVKAGESPRPICYCTGRTVESIEEELRTAGRSTAVQEIGALCKAHKDRCPETNPQGSCCLGNVHAVIAAAEEKLARSAASDVAERDCCAVDAATAPPTLTPPPMPAGRDRSGMFATGGAVAAAVLSSACCWLPLALIGVGTSAGGVAGVFEQYRGVLLGITALLLGGGFYLVYFRAQRCEPGSACETPNPRLQRANKAMLWIATVVVAAFALFPNYVGTILGGGDRAPIASVDATDAALVRSYRISGMTCESCVEHVTKTITGAAGVVAAEVDYASETARVQVASAGIADGPVLSAIASIGYTATRLDAPVARLFRVDGMTCESCATTLRATIANVPGVLAVDVSYAAKTVTVRPAADAVNVDLDIISAIESAGYQASRLN